MKTVEQKSNEYVSLYCAGLADAIRHIEAGVAKGLSFPDSIKVLKEVVEERRAQNRAGVR